MLDAYGADEDVRPAGLKRALF